MSISKINNLIEEAISNCCFPGTDESVLQASTILSSNANKAFPDITLSIKTGYLLTPKNHAALKSNVKNALAHYKLAERCNIKIQHHIAESTTENSYGTLKQVKHIIAIASGKGGVGKSTIAANLALAASKMGAKVGLLDADIYGPSVGLMLGIPDNTQPRIEKNKDQQLFIPIQAYNLQTMSMAYLVNEKTPMVWRGPMATGALLQLILNTKWHELDYLFVDMPPGTGDIQLTMAQRVPVSGSVVITTPQDLALLDAKKGIEMFNKVNIPVLGIIENMATHTCTQCGHQEAIFGEKGGTELANQYKVPLLGSLPLALDIRESTDTGCPTVAGFPDSNTSLLFQEITSKMTAKLWSNNAKQHKAPVITTTNT